MLLVSVVLAVAFGLYRAATDGRFRGTHRVRGADSDVTTGTSPVDGAGGEAPAAGEASALHPGLAALDLELGDRATLVQFSSAFCAPCRSTRRTLTEVAELVPGVVHVEIDAEHHLELVRALGVQRTPTTLLLDTKGVEVTRAAGAPTKDQVLDGIARIG